MPDEHDTTNKLLYIREARRLVNLVLRYAASGGVAILSFAFIQRTHFDFLRVGADKGQISVSLLIFAVFVIGAVLYAIHRALLYRMILPVLRSLLSYFKRRSERTRELEKRHTNTRVKMAENDPLWLHYDTWASEVHFLYSSAWAGFATLLVTLNDGHAFDVRCFAVLIASAVLLLAALTHDWSMMSNKIDREGTQPATKPLEGGE